MRDVLYLEEIEQAEALLKPQRVEVLRQLAEPRTCSEVAERLGQTPQRVYYHVKRLVEAGLVDLVSERKVRGIHEGIYQAGARSYWLSPRLVGRIGLRKARDELSLGYLLDLMEEVQSDIAALDRSAPELPSIGLSGEIRVRPEERQEFLNDLQTMLQGLFTRYGGAEGDAFKLAVACYPNAAADPPADIPEPGTPPAAPAPPAPTAPPAFDAPPAPTDETGPHRRPDGGDRPQPA
ncbi:helix-turn-helix domain-containing protein [Nonomuraea sp. NPDC051941]|uniref:helix-turn-helix domain-containing protein n=1 Tax=Nonomuraea sp. NPDC051941 TaxID=3364373 RepID=UPI0037C7BE3B